MKNLVLIACLFALLTACSSGQTQSSTNATMDQQLEILRQTRENPRPPLDIAAQEAAKNGYECGAGGCYCGSAKACDLMIHANVCPDNGTFKCGGGGTAEPACSCQF